MNKMSEDTAELTSSAAAVEEDTNEQMQDEGFRSFRRSALCGCCNEKQLQNSFRLQ